MIDFGQVLILVGIVSVAIIAGVFAGAYAVFRTKREPHETFTGKSPKGEVFSIENWGDETELDEPTEPPEVIQSRNNDFVDQLANGLGGRV